MSADIRILPTKPGTPADPTVSEKDSPELQAMFLQMRKLDSDWKSKLSAQLETVAQYDRERNERENLLRQASRRIQELTAVAEQLKARVAATEGAGRQVEARNAELVQRLQAARHELEETVRSHAAELRMHEQVIASWRSALDQARAKIEALEDQLRSAGDAGEGTARELRRQIRGLEDRGAERDKDIGAERARCAFLESELRRAQGEADHLRSQLQAAARFRGNASTPAGAPTVISAPSQLNEALASLQGQQSEKARLEAENAQLKQTLLKTRASAQQAIDQAAQQLQATKAPAVPSQAQPSARATAAAPSPAPPPTQSPPVASAPATARTAASAPTAPPAGAVRASAHSNPAELERMRAAFLSLNPDAQSRTQFEKMITAVNEVRTARRPPERSN